MFEIVVSAITNHPLTFVTFQMVSVSCSRRKIACQQEPVLALFVEWYYIFCLILKNNGRRHHLVCKEYLVNIPIQTHTDSLITSFHLLTMALLPSLPKISNRVQKWFLIRHLYGGTTSILLSWMARFIAFINSDCWSTSNNAINAYTPVFNS